MEQPGVEGRVRALNGEIARKHGNPEARTLRNIYGMGFAHEFHPADKLADIIASLDAYSLSRIAMDYADGKCDALKKEACG